MSDEPSFKQIKPNNAVPADAVARPWVILMSDWPTQYIEKLLTWIEGAFEKTEQQGPLPTILVVEDIGSYEPDYQGFLTKLTKAGAFVLELEDGVEDEVVRKDPIRFARDLLAASQQVVASPGPRAVEDYQKWLGTADASAVASASGAPPATPSHPDAFREFAKAWTRLPDDDLKDMMKPRD